MNCVLLIERDGQKNAVKLSLDESQTICIGRSWNSDIVVDDKYVDSEHLKISANDDKFLIEDLDSQNGTRLQKQVINGEASCDFGDAIVVGETTLRLVDANSQVAPAVKYDGISRMIRKYGIAKSVILASLITVLAFAAQLLWGQSLEVTTSKVAKDAISIFMLMFGWVVAIGIVTKLFTKKTKFSLHWLLACGAFTLFVLLGILENLIHFNLSSPLLDKVVNQGAKILVSSLFIYGVLSLATRFKKLHKFAFILVTSLTMLFLSEVAPKLEPAHERWSEYSTISHSAQPPQFFIGKTVSLDMHLNKTEKLFEQKSAD